MIFRMTDKGVFSNLTAGEKVACPYDDFAECRGTKCAALRWLTGTPPEAADLANNPAGFRCYCGRAGRLRHF